MESEDIVHSTTEPEIEEVHVSPTAAVAEEHDYQKEDETLSAQEDDDDDLYGDVEFLKEIDFTGISDDIPTNIEFDLNDEYFGPFPGIPSSCLNKFDEVASSATKIREEGNVLKNFLSTSKPMEVASSQGDVTSDIPPFVSSISTSALIVPDSTQPQTSQSSMETITATTAYSPPKQFDEGPSTMFETGGSSSILEYSPTIPSLDEASIRLAKHLAQHSPTSSRGKGISFREERSGDDKSSSPDLREEIGILRQGLIEKTIQMDQITSYIEELRAKDEEKTKQIKDLQMSLGSVTASYFNLKNASYDTFGNRVKVLFQQPHGIDDPPIAHSHSASDDLPFNPPAPRKTTVVNRFEKELEGSRARITIKEGKRTVTANQSEDLLFMKNSNENRKAKDPVLTVMDLKKRKFGNEFGDRSRIRMWAFDPETNLWVVKRNLGTSEFYKSSHDFNSWTKIDLAELSRAPFHNPSEDPSASNFKRFLDKQVKENFPKMKTARALYRKDKEVLDPESGEPMKIILWPATKQHKEIHIPQHFQEGYLDKMEFWAYDDETATTAIKFKDREKVMRLISAKDLLRFRERGIRTLSHHQIICRKDVMEAAAKEFTAMVATITNGRMWMRSMGRLDLKLYEKPNE
ncbi:unnamed protein product [Lactuca saligna]|uniref:Uncharacterized protein n=1 Tax=Lactuca saligna TaxID=75948 RepID=A0AA36A5P7_LACSI|nr:unnamed protein product [Lactuca saligna]